MMELPGQEQPAASDRVRQVTVLLRPGACTIVDWAASVAAEDSDGDSDGTGDGDPAQGSDAASDSEDPGEEGGYTSNAPSLPPAIANDPFFARLLRNAEMREADEKRKKKSVPKKRRTKDGADDAYDLDDPFIDDSELTLMDSHSYAKTQQRKKRRKRDDGDNTEAEAPAPAPAPAPALGDGEPVAAAVAAAAAAAAAPSDELGAASLDDLDRYEEDDFFVYYGPLNDAEAAGSDTESFEAPAKPARPRSRPEKKQPTKPAAPPPPQAKKKAAGAKGDGAEPAAKKRAEAKAARHRRTSSGSIDPAGQTPSNGRKAGPRTSRKLGPAKSGSALEAGAADGGSSARAALPPIPDRDRPAAGSGSDTAAGASSAAKSHPARRADTPVQGGAALPPSSSSATVAPSDAKAIAAARQPTPEIEAALSELGQAAQGEAFTNRQRFPSSLKPSLRQVCELSMARALEHDREMMALETPEHKVFAWSTPVDIVGFTAGIYHRLSDILPYNRATVRKIVSKLLGQDLLTWKEQQLKQIEEGLKARVDDQIERNMGWIPVAARAGAKEGDEAPAQPSGGAQVRWHWTTLSKHILYQYMVLTLSINELRNSLGQITGKEGAYREQQARKDAYAHLVNLWPGSSMSTYEISRAYSSRKSLLEKQNKKNDPAPVALARAPGGGDAPPPAATSPPPPPLPPPAETTAAAAPAAAEPGLSGAVTGLGLTTEAATGPAPSSPVPKTPEPPPPPPPPPPAVASDAAPLPGTTTGAAAGGAAGHPSPYAQFERMSSPRFDGYGQPPTHVYDHPPPYHHHLIHHHHHHHSHPHQAASPQPAATPAYHGGTGSHFGTPVAPYRNISFGTADQAASAEHAVHDQPRHHSPAGDGDTSSSRYSMSVRNLTTP
ncbi:hypothetical protein H4R18_001820 [Coemansia javaensis]|uniref:Ubinuclein middle domain-containing protein n=1 Tax=Coemansia javaensis TaxID=2761396 RepID=A0A9W8LIM1_9FUNG|nr:hypothetical protein H4R18_001820 [Coemansia javaensis]